jgi:pterin-4a-carbinolamine dehydratase
MPLMAKLTAAQIKIRLASIPEWKKRGGTISRTYRLKD